jgi:hypothetical protein
MAARRLRNVETTHWSSAWLVSGLVDDRNMAHAPPDRVLWEVSSCCAATKWLRTLYLDSAFILTLVVVRAGDIPEQSLGKGRLAWDCRTGDISGRFFQQPTPSYASVRSCREITSGRSRGSMAQGDARIGFFWVAGINRRPLLYWTSLGAIPTRGLALNRCFFNAQSPT